MFHFLFQGMKIFQRQQNFKAKHIEKKLFVKMAKLQIQYHKVKILNL
jgi:hypothetical protein